jgi:Acyltransferase family.
MYFLDNLRAFIILLVVVFHVAMGYTTWNLAWWVNDMRKSGVFDLFVLATDVYMMPVMFLIAGYFAPAAMGKNGIAGFWRAKWRRIVLPWLGGALLIAPAVSYAAIFSHTDTPPNYFSFWMNDFWGKYYQQAHYWFLGILTLFFLLFTIAYIGRPRYFIRHPAGTFPARRFFPLFALITAVLFFCANLFYWCDEWVNCHYLFMIQPVRIGLYLCYFGLGIHAWKNRWFTAGGYRPGLFSWGCAALVMQGVFLAYRVAFTLPPDIPVLYKAGHAALYAVFSLTATMALIALFAAWADSGAYLWRRLAANSFTIYFIHQCVIIPLAYSVRKVPLQVGVKYVVVSAAALALCFLLAEYLIRPLLSPATFPVSRLPEEK